MNTLIRTIWRGLAILVVALCAFVGAPIAPVQADAVPDAKPPVAPILKTTPLAWGYNLRGQLGNNTADSHSPLAVEASCLLAGKTIIRLASGEDFTLALDNTGHIYAWGDNSAGQLGNPTVVGHSNVPVAVDTSGVLAGKTIIAVAAGESHSLALDSAGVVYAWGYNLYGQLGVEGIPYSYVPVAVDTSGVLAGKTITAVAAGFDDSLALDSTGHVYAWGYNGSGQLGNGSTTQSPVPLPVAVDTSGVLVGKTITAIAAGSFHSLALDSTGHVYAWGNNNTGQLGINQSGTAISSSNVPVAVYESDDLLIGYPITAISAGGIHSLAVGSNGNVYAWGDNTSGQLGDGTQAEKDAPEIILDGDLQGKPIIAVAAGKVQSYAVDNQGQMYAWGDNSFGATGTGGSQTITTSKQVHFLGDAAVNRVSIGGTARHRLVLAANTDTPDVPLLFDWGYNYNGQLGNASTADEQYPSEINTTCALQGKTLVAVAAGADHSLALDSDGQVYGWGDNVSGQLGNNSTIISPVPSPVFTDGYLKGKTIVAISAGEYYSLALDSRGHAYAWGLNDKGQLGNESVPQSLVPVPVFAGGTLAGKTIVAISAGVGHSLALDNKGHVYAWGLNDSGQLGDGTTTNTGHPVAVNTGNFSANVPIIAISAGGHHSLALDRDGHVYAWGNNDFGEIGNGTTTNTPIKVPVAVDRSGALNGKTITAIAAGGGHSLALDNTGAVYAWGENYTGQLGNDSTNKSPVPLKLDAFGDRQPITAISAGAEHSLARDSFGQMWAWGDNIKGQLGLADTNDRLVPTDPEYPPNSATLLVSGSSADHSLALAQIPTTLTFSTQPVGGAAGAPLAIQPVVAVTDAFGQIDTYINDGSFGLTFLKAAITLKPGTGTPGAYLTGIPTTVSFYNGVAAFAYLAINTPGTGYVLTVSASPILHVSSADSQPFMVGPPGVTMHLRTDTASIKASKGRQYVTTLDITNGTTTTLPAGTTLTYSLDGLAFKTGAATLTGGATLTGATPPKGKTPGSISATLDSALAFGGTLHLTLNITGNAGPKTALNAVVGGYSSNSVTGVKTDGSVQDGKVSITRGNVSIAYDFFANNEPVVIIVSPLISDAPTSAVANSTGNFTLNLSGLTPQTKYKVTVVGAWSGVSSTAFIRVR